MNAKYANELKEIRDRFVPERDQATALQGELLRILEKIQHEIQDSGMANWDDNFQYMASFLKEKLMHDVFKDSKDIDEGDRAVMCAVRIERQGAEALRASQQKRAMKWLEGNGERLLEDGFYEPMYCVIAEWYVANPNPIEYKHEREISG